MEFEYQTDVLADALVDQMLAHIVQLLDNALTEPDRRLDRLDMLGDGERADVLAQSHGELVATPPTTMVALLEAAGDRHARCRRAGLRRGRADLRRTAPSRESVGALADRAGDRRRGRHRPAHDARRSSSSSRCSPC